MQKSIKRPVSRRTHSRNQETPVDSRSLLTPFHDPFSKNLRKRKTHSKKLQNNYYLCFLESPVACCASFTTDSFSEKLVVCLLEKQPILQLTELLVLVARAPYLNRIENDHLARKPRCQQYCVTCPHNKLYVSLPCELGHADNALNAILCKYTPNRFHNSLSNKQHQTVSCTKTQIKPGGE